MYEKLAKWIKESDDIVFFGGAGVSTESNIPDFRSEAGIYKAKSKYGYTPETILSHSFFANHPDIFYKFYKNTMIYKDAQPNSAHTALAKLEKQGKLKAVITQNIDGLHQKAGSKKVLELHGTVHSNHCTKCGKGFTLDDIINSKGIPKCDKCAGIIKPNVVLYEEQLNDNVMIKAAEYIAGADMLIVAGTSLNVYPAAGLIRYYKGRKLVLINKSETPFDNRADLLIHDSVGKVLSEAIV